MLCQWTLYYAEQIHIMQGYECTLHTANAEVAEWAVPWRNGHSLWPHKMN